MVCGVCAKAPSDVDEERVNEVITEIDSKVLRDVIAQYEIMKRSGSAMGACAQAGLVVAAQLQAKNGAAYKTWKFIERRARKRAGLRR